MDFRHELKFRLSALNAAVLMSRLPRLMAYDPFNADTLGRYDIYSLYFDTPEDRALREKQSGVSEREKFRLRYYGEKDNEIHVEKKFKQNGLCGKLMGQITRAECESLLSGPGGDAFMLSSPYPVVRELYVKMRTELLEPRTLVAYTRQAFVYEPGNVRVTLDSALRTHARCTDFFDRDGYRMDPNDKGFVLLEVKYDGFLPRVIYDALQIDLALTSYSKFEACHLYD